MASTYSALKIELIGTGEQSGTWGTTTNTNLGDAALGEAITGSADVSFSSSDVTVTLTDTNATQTARNLRLNLTGTSGGARNLILGSGCQIEKLYLVNNGLADAVTVKNTSGTGIAVPAGKSMFVYNNGTNVVDAVTHATSLTLGSALPIASGGTGTTSTTFTNLTTNVTGTLPIANGGTGATTLAAATIATQGYTTTVTAAGTTTLTVSSTQLQFFTGSTTQTVTLPVASTLTAGQRFEIHNNSSGSVTVNSSGANLVATVLAGTTTVCTCILTSGTTAASWDADIQGFTTTVPIAQGGTGASTLAGANIAVLNSAQTFTASQRGTITVLTDGATITPDFSVTNNYSVTLGGNRTLANPTNITAGQSGSIFVSQDATGSRTLAFGTNWDFAGGTAPTLSTAASAVDRIDYVVRTATSIHTVFTANYS